MAAPVLGGLLVADEAVDLLLPVAFYWIRRRRWKRCHGDPVAENPTLLHESDPTDDLPVVSEPALREVSR